MSHVVKNNRGFLQLLSDYPSKQRQFLLRTATPQQLHALVQIIYNVLTENIPVSEEVRAKLRSHKDALVNLAQRNIPYKTKKRTLVQEGSRFIQELLTPVISSLGLSYVIKGTMYPEIWSFVFLF